MKVAYPAIIHEEDTGVWAEFFDLPGCYSDGETVADCVSNASEALGAYLCSILDNGKPLPRASDPRRIAADGCIVSVVVSDPLKYKKSTKAVKKTLTIPEWMNVEAERAGINFSQVLQEGIINKLGI